MSNRVRRLNALLSVCAGLLFGAAVAASQDSSVVVDGSLHTGAEVLELIEGSGLKYQIKELDDSLWRQSLSELPVLPAQLIVDVSEDEVEKLPEILT